MLIIYLYFYMFLRISCMQHIWQKWWLAVLPQIWTPITGCK